MATGMETTAVWTTTTLGLPIATGISGRMNTTAMFTGRKFANAMMIATAMTIATAIMIAVATTTAATKAITTTSRAGHSSMVRIASIAVLLSLAGGTWAAQRPKARPVREQLSFSADKLPQRPASVSPETLEALLQTPEAKNGMRLLNPTERKDPARLFRGADVHLTGPEENDLIVIGTGPMAGADKTWFWVVRTGGNGSQVIGFATGYSLRVMGSTTNGYKDFECRWLSGALVEEVIYHFDGGLYKKWKTTEQQR